MRKNFLLAACAVLALSVASVGSAHAQGANLITNGDFSNGLSGWTGTGTASSYTAYSNPVTGYGASNGPYGYPYFGVLADSQSGSTLTTTFTTVSGTNYSLSFDSGTFNDPASDPEILYYTISVAGEIAAKSGHMVGYNDTDFSDIFVTLAPPTGFQGDGQAATITFYTSAIEGSPTPGYGVLLTDVIVQDVPEPSSFALVLTGLVGIAGLGFARSRGRKSI